MEGGVEDHSRSDKATPLGCSRNMSTLLNALFILAQRLHWVCIDLHKKEGGEGGDGHIILIGGSQCEVPWAKQCIKYQ